jgi:hypothetical protein
VLAGDKAGTTDSDLLTKEGNRGGYSPTENTSLAGVRASIALPIERNRVERTLNRLKQFQRIATRYEKRADNYLALLTLASIILWL